MKLNVPFYQQPDKNGCVMASLKMALEYFGEKYSWEKLNQMTEREEGRWADLNSAIVKLKEKGWNVKTFTLFDSKRFVSEGLNYLYEIYGKEITEQVYIPCYPFKTAKKAHAEMVKLKIVEMKSLSFKEIENFIKDGFIIMVTINSRIMAGKPGYMGHVVIITGFDDKNVWYHESSFDNPQPNKKVDKDLFIKAHEDRGTDNEVIVLKK